MYLDNTIGCQLYKYGRCGLYPEKPCIGDECIIWSLYKKNKENTKIIEDQTIKILFLLRMLCHSENSKMSIQGNKCTLEFNECQEKFCFIFENKNDFVLEKFFDLDCTDGKLSEVVEVNPEILFQKIGL